MASEVLEKAVKDQPFTGGNATAWAKERFAKLMAEDEQFRGTIPLESVTEAKSQPGLRLAEVIRIVMEGYADRAAIAERARELVTDPASGRTISKVQSRFESVSFGQLWDRAKAFATSWNRDDKQPLEAGGFAAMLGYASTDFAAAQIAVMYLGAVNVPLAASGTPEQAAAIIAETEPPVMGTSIRTIDLAVDTLLAGSHVPRLMVMDYDPRDDDQRERFDAASRRLKNWNAAIRIETADDLVAQAKDLPEATLHISDEEDPLAWLFYTSGTTGSPKGAMITEQVIRKTWLHASDKPSITMSFMPMSHMVGYGYMFLPMANGGTAYCTANPDLSLLFEDLALARPTMSSLVPRVCEMLYQHYLGEVDRRIAQGEDEAAAQAAVKDDIRENLLGGRLISVGCGSALLSPEVHEFMISMLRVHMAIGYSSTEMATATVLVDGKIQKPPVIDYRLEDVPELGYFTTDKPFPRGEFLVKIPKFMDGYYKRPDLTAEKFTADGFYRSGDVMALVGPDELVYLDRTNNVQKLSQGEFVAIAKLESLYTQHPAISQIFVYGTSERAFLLAVVVPSKSLLAGFDGSKEAEDRLKAEVKRGLNEIAGQHGLNSYEVPRDVLIETERFSPENGLLTGTGKFSRPNLKEHYRDRLEQMFAQMAQDQVDQLRELRLGGKDRTPIENVIRGVQATLGISESDVSPQSRFVDLGGDSLSALSLSMLLEEIFGVEVPVGVIINPAGSLQLVADYVEAQISGGGRTSFADVHGSEPDTIKASDLKLERFIPVDILDAAPSLPAPPEKVRTVLLTGSTGFLGRFQAMAWLEHFAREGEGKLVLIARGTNPDDARERIEAALESDPDLLARFRELGKAHLEVLPGDLGLPRLGLEEATWQRLAAEIDLIAHTAAHVNHVLPYAQLFGANVGGTAELVRLALTTRLKRFDYVGTLGVMALSNGPVDEDCDIREEVPGCRIADSYANGYNISKWAGEVLLREANDLCDLPVSVFRPGMILAHRSYKGQLNVPDMFTRLLYSLAVTGVAPATFYAESLEGGRPASRYEGLAVDFMADAITEIGLHDAQGYHSYNLAYPGDDGASLDDFVDWMIEAGCEIERIGRYSEWVDRAETAMHALPEDQRQQSMLTIMDPWKHPQAAAAKNFLPVDRFSSAARAAGHPIPGLDAALIHKYVADLRHLNLLQPARESV